MEQDMHYYGIGFLARAAGIPKETAHRIAYASQYVDDSTESVAIRVGGGSFDTVRTAHLGFEAWSPTVHKTVYVPFHFLPSKPITRLGDSYVTKADSEFARLVLKRALREKDVTDRIIAVGIAMHTYADTFSHEGFTGRDDDENRIRKLARWEDGEWRSADFSNLIGNLTKGVGHMLAFNYPDLPWLRWRYERRSSPGMRERNNPTAYLKALKAIHEFFTGMPEAVEPGIEWRDIELSLKDIIAIESVALEPRILGWITLYGDRFRDARGYRNIRGYRYDPLMWRSQAVEPVGNFTIAWDDLRPADLLLQKFKPRPGFLSSNWARFHNMALKQRHFVQQRIVPG